MSAEPVADIRSSFSVLAIQQIITYSVARTITLISAPSVYAHVFEQWVGNIETVFR